MGCSIFNVEIWKKIHFGREKWPICKILTSNRKFKVAVTLKTTLPKSEAIFRDNIGTFLFECMDFKDLCTSQKDRYVPRHSGFEDSKDTTFTWKHYYVNSPHIQNFTFQFDP